MKLLSILFLFFSLGLSGNLFAQERSTFILKGNVFTTLGNLPIQGVSINAQGSDQVTISGSDGSFTILIKPSVDSLLFNFIGYQRKTIPVQSLNDRQQLRVFLKEQVNKIEEVVVSTGYQTLKSNEVTGSAQVVDNEMLNQQVGTNILERLNNVTTGIRFDNQPIGTSPTKTTNISIRGLSTIDGNLDPLIVLDGFIYEGDITNIDPNNIDNITILKDAAAAAIWGARAGNGVIVITSKSNKPGQKVAFSFNNTLTVKQKPNLYDVYQPSVDEFIELEETLFRNGYYDRQISRTPYSSLTPATEIFYQRQKGNLSAADSAAGIQALKQTDLRKAFMDEFLVRPVIQQYSLNILGSSALHSYSLGLGYTASQGESDARSDKINIRIGNTFRPVKHLRVDVNLMFTNQKNKSGMPSYSRFNYGGKNTPYGRLRSDSGEPLRFDNTYRQEYISTLPTDGFLDWGYYPFEDYKLSKSQTAITEFYPTVNVSYKLFPFLDLNIGGQYQYQTTDNSTIDELESYAARLLINQFSYIDPLTGEVGHNIPVGGMKRALNNRGSSYTGRSQLNVDKSWTDHRIIGLLGTEIRENLDNGESFKVYGYSDDPLRTVPVDYSNTYRVLPGNGSASIQGSPDYTQTRNRFISVYGNFSYLFGDRYGVSASIRRDGANIFGATTNDKWSPLWSTGLLWNINEERFFPKNIFSVLKMRATYGFSGNVDLRKTPLPIAASRSARYTNLPALVVNTLNDPSLRWEKVSTLNFGIDFSLANDRISGTVDYYVKNGVDLYGTSAYDYTVWGKSPTITKNVAAMRGSGIDFMLRSKNLNKRLTWETTLMFGYNRNTTKDYYQRFYAGYSDFLGNGNQITPVKGLPLYGIAAFKSAGLDAEGNPQGYLDNEVSTDYKSISRAASLEENEGSSIAFYGSGKPQVFGSIINTFQYRGISLSFNISFKGSYSFLKPTTTLVDLYASGTAYPDFEVRWRHPGDELKTDVPSLVYPASSERDRFYRYSEVNIRSGDHLRLEYINFSYRPVLRFMDNPRSFEVYGNVSNLGLLWTKNKEGIDPEFPYRLKPQKTFAFGIKANF